MYMVFVKVQYTFAILVPSRKPFCLTPIQGDRVAICSRNYPEYLVAFWACRKFWVYDAQFGALPQPQLLDLIGAVSVLANA
jgi:hypothetical protein